MAKSKRGVGALAQLLRVLGDGTRLRIVLALQKQELNVTQLCQKLSMPQPSVSRHLGILRLSGLVKNRRDGKEIFYSMANLARVKHGKTIQTLLDAA